MIFVNFKFALERGRVAVRDARLRGAPEGLRQRHPGSGRESGPSISLFGTVLTTAHSELRVRSCR